MKSPVLFWSAAGVVLVLTAGSIAFSLSAFSRKSPTANVRTSTPQVDLPLGDFALMDASGKTFTRNSLRGRVWIVNAVYSRCPGPCSRMTQETARLQEQLSTYDQIRFLSVTVDPDFDTPAVLKEYAKVNGADESRWIFLTGPKTEVRRFIQQGLRLAVEELPPGETGPEGPITHSTKFILLDAETRIRGYYDGLDSQACAKLARDARLLLSR